MTLRTDLIHLANDYGIPGRLVLGIVGDAARITFTYANIETPEPLSIAKTLSIDASPIGAGDTPVYDALAAERATARQPHLWREETDLADSRRRYRCAVVGCAATKTEARDA
ncbi:MAG: hypothetical protein ACYC1Z_03465 [Georgenia sp.]